MPAKKVDEKIVESIWHAYLTGGEAYSGEMSLMDKIVTYRPLAKRLPGTPRCKMCSLPFKGLAGNFLKMAFSYAPSKLNPQLCNMCEQFIEHHQGGAEVELTMLFADVRGSTRMAEELGTTEFSQLISRFYKVTTGILIHADALIEKLMGDQVTGLFAPGIAGRDHAQSAIHAAEKIMLTTGHNDPQGPWAPVGIGIHTAKTFVGAVGQSQGVTDIVALGDGANTTARIMSLAQAGEILISADTASAAQMKSDHLEKRSLSLKGRVQPIDVFVLSVSTTREKVSH
jgi:adenylate cyclase